MDGQVFTNPLQSRRCIPAILLIAVAGLLLPAVARAQAMGKAQVDAVAIAHVDPPALPVASGALPAAAHELVALAPDPKLPTAAEKAAADDKVRPAVKPSAVDADAGKPAKTLAAPAVITPTPAAADGAASKSPGSAAATPDVTPRASAIESSLIKPPAKETTTVAPTETAAVTPPGQTSLYARFSSVGQVAAALLVVVGLILVGRALVRKFVPGTAAGTGKGVMEILARYPLAKNQSLVLVRIGSQLVVLNQTREASQSVMVIHDQVEVANILGQIQGSKPSSIQNGFSNLLANARMDLETTPPDGNEASIELGDLDSQLDEMAAAKRQLMELRQQVRSVRESLPIG
jgi:flagellar biogenesis protein FliO